MPQSNRGRKRKTIDGIFANRLMGLLQIAKKTRGTIFEDVASSIGVSRQALGKWANGDTLPDIMDLKKLAEYFGVSADYLIGLCDEYYSGKVVCVKSNFETGFIVGKIYEFKYGCVETDIGIKMTLNNGIKNLNEWNNNEHFPAKFISLVE